LKGEIDPKRLGGGEQTQTEKKAMMVSVRKTASMRTKGEETSGRTFKNR